ncbi:hypothetical protein MPSEU_000817900 [Mayamaea pseudoterrestris]|nr:hypothetical protein MPSEU_000817900 [Mayamaea pseudoterrestris]
MATTNEKKKTLFEDDDDVNEAPSKLSSSFKIDEKFAAAFESRKQKEELKQIAQNGGGGSDDDDASSSSDEDDDAQLLTEELDVNIFKTINALRAKDDKIYDSSVRFFENGDDEDSADDNDDEDYADSNKKGKPKRYKDVIREQVLEQMDREEGLRDDSKEQHSTQSRLAYDAEQQEIRKAFLTGLGGDDDNDASSDSDDEGTLLKVKRRHKPSDDYALNKELEQELEKLKATADSKDLVDPRGEVKDGEAFLLDYFKKKTWKRGGDDSDGSDSDDDDASNQEVSMKHSAFRDDDSLDDVDKADDFESQYNFRFEQAAAANSSGADRSLVSYARDMTGTLRRKDESRREKRLARQERKAAERKAKEEELKRLKNLKRQEMNEKLRQVKTVLGEVAEGRAAEAVDEAAILKLIEGDFDPDKYEELMKNAYGDDFYNSNDAEWKSELDVRNTLKNEEDGDLLIGQDDEDGGLYDDNQGGYYDEEGEYDQDDEAYYDEENEAWQDEEGLDDAAATETPLERQVREKLTDELYKLDYEDIVAGQPTRFKYRKVEANSYGLSTEEILFARDTTLRQFVSLKQMAPYNEREFHANSKKRRRFRDLLKQELEEGTKEENVVEGVHAHEAVDEEVDEEAEEKPKKKSRRSKKKSKDKVDDDTIKVDIKSDVEGTETELTANEAMESDEKAMSNSTMEKKKKRKKKHKSKDPVVAGLSESRLAAYGL